MGKAVETLIVILLCVAVIQYNQYTPLRGRCKQEKGEKSMYFRHTSYAKMSGLTPQFCHNPVPSQLCPSSHTVTKTTHFR